MKNKKLNTTILTHLDQNRLDKLVDLGYLRSQTHSTLPLTIWNYTNNCQWEQEWNEYTLICRGLVVDNNNKIVARCLPKFFNYSELQLNQLPNEDFVIYDKLDGSYINLFWYEGQWIVTSRGSFDSDQSRLAKDIISNRIVLDQYLDKTCNYIFELIHPDNRIVVDYGLKQDLVLLAIINNETGEEINIFDYEGLFTLPSTLTHYKESFEVLKSYIENDKEGFVIKYNNGFRMKIKGDEYCRLHKIVTQTSTKDIYKMLMDNKDVSEYIERVPDEFKTFFYKTCGEILIKYKRIEQQIQKDWLYGIELGLYYYSLDRIILNKSRKEISKYFNSCIHNSPLFNKLDNYDYSDYIWKQIKPDFSKAYSI